MKKHKQSLVFSLSALSAAMLCQTASTYASDIEIYKAPTTGGATLMLILDLSGSMSQNASNPVNTDFFNGNSCTKETKSISTDLNGTSYSFNGNYCYITQSTYDGLTSAWKTRIDNQVTAKTCIKSEKQITTSGGWGWGWGSETTSTVMTYSCPDRVTMLKRSLFDLIVGNSSVEGSNTTTNTPLPNTSSIGLTTFYNAIPEVKSSPLLLNSSNKSTLLNIIKGWEGYNGTPIAEAYSVGAASLMNYVSTAETACAGYGLYYLTDGDPSGDSLSNAAKSSDAKYLNNYLQSSYKLTTGSGGNCTSSWGCVNTAADFLVNKRASSGTEVKTAVVGFGKDFSFSNSSGENITYNPGTTYTDTILSGYFSGNALAAAKAAVAGKGGWYSAANTNDIVNSVQNFVNSIKIPIPAITTGTSAIPQDSLNAANVQPYAYFPQFQPKPGENYRAWTGNLKKYKVVDGLLKDKNNAVLFSSAGVLNTSNEDLWTPNYASSTALTSDEQVKKQLGGILSRLNLKKATTGFNRKLYTSDGSALVEITESYIKQAPASRGYYLGLLGYDLTDAEVQSLTASTDLATLSVNKELRQIGAVMHSTPLLLTQSGKIVNSNAGNDTTDRDDYVLFGTTQGVLHIVKAGKESEINTVGNTAGTEVFAFVPQEMLAQQGKAFLDPPQTVNAADTSSSGMSNLYYGVDGAWTAYTDYVYNSGEEKFKVYDTDTKYGKQWVYGGLRMGGRSYYALDLTRLSAAANNTPKLKFRINPAAGSVDRFNESGTAVTTPYANLNKMGESWSKPTIANVQWKGKRRLVMFVGGGYDRGYEAINYDQDSVTQNTATGRGAGIGAGVYMFDANTGELLWSTYDAVDTAATNASTTSPKTVQYIGNGNELKYSIVSQIKTVDRNGDGNIDHLYFGDLGGQVFRIDLNSKHAASGTAANYAQQITRIYNGHLANGVSPRFYEMPAFTVYSGASGMFAVLSIGSGNRSTPLLGKKVNNSYIVSNESDTAASGKVLNSSFINDAIYNIYDTVVTKPNPAGAALPVSSPTISNLFQITSNQRELAAAAGTNAPSNLAANKETTAYKGWYYAFVSPSLAAGDTRKAVEKVQGDLVVIDNDLYVSTFDAEGTDSTESCGAGIYGTSRAHRFCMPYGQCNNGDTVASNTLALGKGLLGVTIGPGSTSDLASRRIITSVGTLAAGNKITGTMYNASNKLIPQSWYEKN